MQNRLIVIAVFVALLFLDSTAFAMDGERDELSYKEMGLASLYNGEMDSALHYLERANSIYEDDAQILGGLALVHVYSGDFDRALDYAQEGRSAGGSADAYVAGVLAHEELGNVRRRDRWIDRGLDNFPNDNLLLYHAGRIKIPFDNKIGEELLLRSINSASAFGEAHLLLGERMYRKGENVKAVMPLLYYLMLHHDDDQSSDVVRYIEHVFNNWASSSQSISNYSTASSGVRVDFVPEAWDGDDSDREGLNRWFVEQTVSFMESVKSAEITSGESLWLFYSDFFSEVFRLDFANVLALHVSYSRYPDESVGRLANQDKSRKYDMFSNWLLME
ncbi:tetratricopeptide repeat protein [Marinilabiliaceae bacterium ANBcel2]|nr:tetratricopeptide repeat protein [Marinilabiliaceae bacterium ANBcel2]